MSTRMLVAATVLLTSAAAPVAAQTRPAGPPAASSAGALPGVFVAVGAGMALSDGSFDYTITFPLFAETGRIDTNVELDRAFVFDIGGGVRLWKRLGVGATYVRATANGTMTSDISLPNPFLFDDPTTAVAQASTSQTTRQLLIEGLFSIHHSRRWLLVLSGGPSMTSLTQQLATDRFRIDYTFPFETIDVTEVSGEESSATAYGGHIGVSLTWKAGDRFGIDGRFRWAGASVDLEDLNGNRVTVDAGGMQLTGGVRFIF